MFIFRGVCKSFVRSNMCSCNPLRTLSVSDRSCCGAVRILISLAPRNPLGTLCWSALVSALCVGRSVSHCFLLWFPTPHTVCFLLPEQFFGMYILIILVPYMVVKFIGRKKKWTEEVCLGHYVVSPSCLSGKHGYLALAPLRGGNADRALSGLVAVKV